MKLFSSSATAIVSIIVTLMFCLCLLSDRAEAVRLKEVAQIQGVRSNFLIGEGLVVGLGGTGDGAAIALRTQRLLLEKMGVEVQNEKDLAPNNVAVVMVTAELPPFAKEGTRIDVLIESMFNAKSLEGGTLLQTLLYGPEGREGGVYAVAQGPLTVGGFNVGAAGGAELSKNHVYTGRIPSGAIVEREVPTMLTDGQSINLLMKEPDFVTAANLVVAINAKHGQQLATAWGAGHINVIIPEDQKRDLVGFIAALEQVDVVPGENARVIINERTGTVVVGEKVAISPIAVAHGSITVSVQVATQVSQPAPLSAGETVVVPQIKPEVKEEKGKFHHVEGTDVGQIASALNRLGVPTRDLISIFQAIDRAGALHGDLIVM